MTGEGEDWRQKYQAEDEFIRSKQTRGGEFVLSLAVKKYIVIVLCSTINFNTTIVCIQFSIHSGIQTRFPNCITY